MTPRPATNRTGFTIIELMVTIGIIARLMGILLPAVGNAHEAGRLAVSRSNLRQIGIAHQTYGADWAGRHLTFTRDNLGQFEGAVTGYKIQRRWIR